MKQIVLTIIALAALSSCTKNELDGPAAGGRKGEIQVTAGVDGTQTKAYMNKGTGLAGASFIVKEGTAEPTNDFSGGTAYTGDVEATSGKVKFTTAPMYNTNDENAWFVGFFPGGALTNDAIEWDIDGATDIMRTNTIWDAGKYSAPQTTGLNFNHQLSRIEVVLSAEKDIPTEVVRAAWGAIEKVEFLGAPTKMKYDLSGKPAVTTSGTTDFLLLADYNGTAFTPVGLTPFGNTSVRAMAMLAPVAATAFESFKLRVTAEGDGSGPVVLEVPVNLDGNISPMMAGHTHTVTMVFKANDKKIEVTTATVDDWTSGTAGDNELEKPPLPIILEFGQAPFAQTSGQFYAVMGNEDITVPGPTTTSKNSYKPGDKFYTDLSKVDGSITHPTSGEKPYASLEIAFTDETSGGNAAMTWTDALAACKAKAPAGQWRMPHLTEMMLMFLNEPELKTTKGFTAFVRMEKYWSATEENASNVWYLAHQVWGEEVTSTAKTGSNRVRCVREIAGPAAPPSVADYYYEDGSYSTDLDGDKTAVGMVYYVNPDNPLNFKVMSLNEPPVKWNGNSNSNPGQLQWEGGYSYIYIGATYPGMSDNNTNGDVNSPARVNGRTNREILGNWIANGTANTSNRTISAFAAFHWCDSKTEAGGGWYLPALNELQYLCCAYNGTAPVKWAIETTDAPTPDTAKQNEWNARITAAGGTALGVANGAGFWSSTEHNTDYSWWVYFHTCRTHYNEHPDKGYDNAYHVRCILDITK